MHKKNILYAGPKMEKGRKVLVMLHGRGGNAQDILTLASFFPAQDFSLVAPQATQHTWYPLSFLAPQEENEPWLSSALALLRDLVSEMLNEGIPSQDICFLGFSQGACLVSEFLAQNGRRYGGAIILTGGVIGKEVNREAYGGDFQGTPIFISTSNPDFHVPVERVYATSNILTEMGAKVELKVYENKGHNISPDELERADRWVFGGSQAD